MTDRPDIPEEAKRLLYEADRRYQNVDPRKQSEDGWAECLCEAVAPALRKQGAEEAEERLLRKLRSPFLVQAVALECDRLKVDPVTGPKDEDLERVEAEVRMEIERAYALAQEADDA